MDYFCCCCCSGFFFSNIGQLSHTVYGTINFFFVRSIVFDFFFTHSRVNHHHSFIHSVIYQRINLQLVQKTKKIHMVFDHYLPTCCLIYFFFAILSCLFDINESYITLCDRSRYTIYIYIEHTARHVVSSSSSLCYWIIFLKMDFIFFLHFFLLFFTFSIKTSRHWKE